MESEDLFDHQENQDVNTISEIVNANIESPDEALGDVSNDKNITNSNEVMDVTENHANEENVGEEENADSIEKQVTSINKNKESRTQEPKLIQLPLSKIRALMKLDPDLHLASTEAVFSVAKATELFIESLAKESYSFTAQSKKKTIQKRDVDLAIASIDSLMFLEGSMNF